MCALEFCVGYLSLLTLLQAAVLMEKNDAGADKGDDRGSEAERPTGKQTDDDPNKNPSRSCEHTANWSWGWQAIFSLLLVIVGAFQICIYLRQANIAETQAKISRTQTSDSRIEKRASVFFQDIHFTPATPKASDSGVQTVDGWYILPDWKNSGTTQTRNLEFKLACGVFRPSNETDQFDWDEYDRTTGALLQSQFPPEPRASRLLGPGQNGAGGSCKRSADDFSRLIDNHTLYYVISLARYQDVFDREKWHTTRMCIRGTFSGDPHTVQRGPRDSVVGGGIYFGYRLCPGNNNCADEECDEKK